jgi:hypothetical protein
VCGLQVGLSAAKPALPNDEVLTCAIPQSTSGRRDILPHPGHPRPAQIAVRAGKRGPVADVFSRRASVAVDFCPGQSLHSGRGAKGLRHARAEADGDVGRRPNDCLVATYLQTGEMVGAGEDGTHQFLVQSTGDPLARRLRRTSSSRNPLPAATPSTL